MLKSVEATLSGGGWVARGGGLETLGIRLNSASFFLFQILIKSSEAVIPLHYERGNQVPQ